MLNNSQPFTSINAQSLGANVTGLAADARGARGIFGEFEWSGGGSPVGTLYLETAVEESGTYREIAAWPISGNSGSETVEYPNFNGGFIRWRYARTSGTGTGTGKFNLKR